ncbi:MAG: hypothetical protein ACYSSI_01575, partial [Planctomycetota bacterium]
MFKVLAVISKKQVFGESAMAKERNFDRRRFLRSAVGATLAARFSMALGGCNEPGLHWGKRLKALIVTGQSNKWHDWTIISPVLKGLLEETGLFKVDMAVSPAKGAGESEMAKFNPNFANYDVVVLDYDGDDWGQTAKEEFVKYIKNGGGLV